MKAHTEEEFNTFMSQLLETNATLDFYCNFPKVERNVANIEIDLNMLNYLIGQDDLQTSVKLLWDRDKDVFESLLILIAVRKKDDKKIITTEGLIKPINDYVKTYEGVMEFLRGTGLERIFKEKKVKNLVDYVFGVEAGLDSHARKNRSGEAMESLVEQILKKHDIQYESQVKSKKWGKLTEVLGEDSKVFDFAFSVADTIYLCEVNFYGDGGSKPNEVARSYSDIAPKVNSVSGFKFVWVTDGKGWYKAKNKLQEAYYIIPNVFNLTTFGTFLEDLKK